MKAPSAFALYRAPVIEPGQLGVYRDAFAARAFPATPPTESEQVVGFVDAVEMARDLDVYRATVGESIVLGVRVDSKTIPPALLALETERACTEWLAANGRAKVPAAIKRELKERAVQELLRRMPAVPSHAALIYDHVDGMVTVLGSGAAAKAAHGLWREALDGVVPDCGLRPLTVIDRISHHLAPEHYGHLTGDETCADPEHRPVVGVLPAPGRGGEFLVWLWHRSESASGELANAGRTDLRVAWLAERTVGLADGETGKRRMSVRATTAAEDPAVRTALLDGHTVDGLGLHLQRHEGGDIGTVDLCVDRGDLRIGSVKLPRSVSAGDDDVAQLLVYRDALHEVHSAVAEVLLAWATGPGSRDAIGQSKASLERWLSVELQAWLAEHGGADAG